MNRYTIGVVFKNSYTSDKVYHYKWHSELPQGTLAVVCANGEYKVVSVVSCSVGYSDKATKYLVDLIDTKQYEIREMSELKEKEIRKKLKERAAKVSDIAFYKTLAGADPEIRKLLQELEEVTQN